MRLLHTSDWHLGRLLHGSSMLDEQQEALARIVEICREERVNVVLIAGDLYDRAIPPADAVTVFDDTIHQLHELDVHVIGISGNHDSAVRVGVGDRILEQHGVSMRGDATRTGEAVHVPSTDGGPPLRVYPVPYLDPLAIARAVAADSVGEGADGAAPEHPVRSRFTHHDAMAWAMGRVRTDLAAAGPCRSVVVAHTFVTGGDPTESERDLSIGNVEQVAMSVFDGVDMVALGHLHRRQSFQQGRVAYSGTPLPYSFSEQNDIKSVRLVDLAPDGSLTVQQIPLGVGRRMRTLTGTLQELLDDHSLDEATEDRIRVVLTDDRLPLQAMSRIQVRFPHAVELSHQPTGADATRRGATTSERLRRAEPLTVVSEFLSDRRGVPADDVERSILVDAIAALSAEGVP